MSCLVLFSPVLSSPLLSCPHISSPVLSRPLLSTNTHMIPYNRSVCQQRTLSTAMQTTRRIPVYKEASVNSTRIQSQWRSWPVYLIKRAQNKHNLVLYLSIYPLFFCFYLLLSVKLVLGYMIMRDVVLNSICLIRHNMSDITSLCGLTNWGDIA